MSKKIEITILILIVSIFFVYSFWGNITKVFADLAPQYSDHNVMGDTYFSQAQYLGTGKAGVDFTSITFYVIGGSEYSMGSGATGFNFYCYADPYPDFSDPKTCTGLGVWSGHTVTNLTTGTVTSSFPTSVYYPPNTSDILKIKVSQSGVDVGTGRYAYFSYKVNSATNPLSISILGNNAGTGAYVSSGNSNFPTGRKPNASITSWGYCLNSDDNCGTALVYSPSYNIVGVSDPSTGEFNIKLSGSGDFGSYSGSGYRAQLDFFSHCTTGSGATEYKIKSNVLASIRWVYGEQSDATEYVSGNIYKGTGYNTSSDWAFSNVIVPYRVGMNCTFPYTTTIVDPLSSAPSKIAYQDLNIDGSDHVVPDIATDNILLSPSAPSLDDPIAWLVHQIKTFVSDIFSLDFIDMTPYDTLIVLLGTKAPFSYVQTAFTFNSSAPTVSSAIPNMTISFGSAYSLPSVPIVFSGALTTIMSTIRNLFGVIIWGFFFFYLVHLARRLF